jgi:hypothetical protein
MPREYQGASTQTYRKLYGYKKIIAWQKTDDLAWIVHERTEFPSVPLKGVTYVMVVP